MLGTPEVWTGTISGAQSSTSINYNSGSGSGYGGKPGSVNINFGGSNRHGRRGSVQTQHHVNLLLDGRPVLFSGSAPATLRDGDQAVLGGVVKNGTLKASAYRNLTNGARHTASSTLFMVLGVLFIVVGIPFTLLLVGFIFIGVGVFMVLLANHYNKINRLVEQGAASPAAPRPAATETAPPAQPIVS